MGRNINTSSNEYKNLIKKISDLERIIDKRDSEFKITFLRCLKDDGFKGCVAREVKDYFEEYYEDN